MVKESEKRREDQSNTPCEKKGGFVEEEEEEEEVEEELQRCKGGDGISFRSVYEHIIHMRKRH